MFPSREFLESAAMCLYEQCEYPAVRYCILTKLLGKKAPEELYRAFLYSDIVEELYQTQNADGGWGPQVKDPWGYFNYFSKNRKYKFNRKVDCTMEILSLIKQYIDNNS